MIAGAKRKRGSTYTNLVDNHLVETDRSQRRLDNVGDGSGSKD